jgi:hypothetical protein
MGIFNPSARKYQDIVRHAAANNEGSRHCAESEKHRYCIDIVTQVSAVEGLVPAGL